ncbi:hypothetical protein E2C01_065896 [Portunus trituberculatus]|uniref:Uncharacterized protein n=1 Tax=Portunus trituberculatus TaxID=210409 RepID=A0A5B7HK28_PORTR|nr:hypothetical protein [Portunus trituberculatus]
MIPETPLLPLQEGTNSSWVTGNFVRDLVASTASNDSIRATDIFVVSRLGSSSTQCPDISNTIGSGRSSDCVPHTVTSTQHNSDCAGHCTANTPLTIRSNSTLSTG